MSPLLRKSVLTIAASALALLFACAGPAQADSGVTDYGGGCVLDSGNRAATIDALRLRCTPDQQDLLFHEAAPGAAPRGVTSGWVVRPGYVQGIAPAFWIGKTFATGPDGGPLTNRVTGLDIAAWPANIHRGTALLDGRPAWVLDYTPSPTPQVHDEVREVAPGVWFGYSWWLGEVNTLLLTFVVATP
ncbi:hypothetical protein [Nocardia sp. NPDC057227]|uniref:hypothetical protein n=1 Tax=Nocardia sp. NPDC057227 TaxID=3346056 RepID=UPI00362E43E0